MVTISENEAVPTLTATIPTTVSEETGLLNIPLTLDIASELPIEVEFTALQDVGTAVKNVDFMEFSAGSITILSGKSGTILIPIINDSAVENSETFTVSISDVLTSGSTISTFSQPITQEVSISDTDEISLTFPSTAISVAEEMGLVRIPVNISDVNVHDVTFMYTTSISGQSAEAEDFTAANATSFSIDAGDKVDYIEIPITNDTRHEADETFTLTVDDGSVAGTRVNYTQDATITVTIEDYDPRPFLAVTSTNVTVREQDGSITINHLYSNDGTDFDASVTANTMNGTALAGEDFVALSNSTVDFGTHVISIENDDIDEGDETFTLILTAGNEYSIGTPNGIKVQGDPAEIRVTITIIDDDGAPTLTASDATIGEEDGHATINFAISDATTQPVTIWYSTSISSTDTAEVDDFEETRGMATIPPTTLGTAPNLTGSFMIPIVSDSASPNYEGRETFTVTITRVSGAEFGAGITSIPLTVTIIDSELAPIVTVPNGIVFIIGEEAGTVEIPLGIQVQSEHEIEVTYSVFKDENNDTADNNADFTTTTNPPNVVVNPGDPATGSIVDQTVTILSNQMGNNAGVITVPILQDLIYEGDEAFTVQVKSFEIQDDLVLSGTPNPISLNNDVKVTIEDDDNQNLPILSFTSTEVSVDEEVSGGEVDIEFAISKPTSSEVVVTYSTTHGSASSRDFTEVTHQQVTITPADPGETDVTTGVISIPITSDTIREDSESFTVTITNVTNAELVSGLSGISVVVNIIDNDPIPTLFASSTVSVGEADGMASIPLTLSNGAVTPIAVTYTTSIVSGFDTAEDNDFTGQINQTVMITSESTTGEILVPITRDPRFGGPISLGTYEGDETFTVTIGDVAVEGTTISTFTQPILISVTIEDSLEIPTLSFTESAISVNEGAEAVEIDLRLSNRTTDEVEITYSTSIEGTDTAQQDDFADMNNQIMAIQRGLTGKISIPIVDDQIDEEDESFTITLNSVSGANFGQDQSGQDLTNIAIIVTILDDDVPELSIVVIDPNPSTEVIEFISEGVDADHNTQGIQSAIVFFAVRANIKPVRPLTIAYTPVSTFIESGSGIPTVTQLQISDFTRETDNGITYYEADLIEFTIHNDEVAERNEYFVVSLQDEIDQNGNTVSGNYSVVAGVGASARIFIIDDDAPESDTLMLSISGPTEPVVESLSPLFTVTATENPQRPLTVRYTPANINGNFFASAIPETREKQLTFKETPNLDGNGTPVVDQDGNPVVTYTAILPISLEDDSFGEKRNNISITLVEEQDIPTAHKTYSVDQENNSATAIIVDDDAPEISIADGPIPGMESDDPLNPGVALFPISVNIVPTKRLNIQYTPTSTSNLGTVDYLDVAEQSIQTVVDPGIEYNYNVFTTNLPVRIQSDDLIEKDGSITVVIHEDVQLDDHPTGITYSLSPNDPIEATTRVNDDDVAVITIGSSEPVPEGDIRDVVANEPNTAEFPITLNKLSEIPITVEFAVGIVDGDTARLNGEDSDFLTSSGVVTFPALNTSQTAIVEIKGDDVFEADETYTVALANPRSEEPDSPADDVEILVESVKGTIENDDTESGLPEISIVANHEPLSVEEGETISFNITSFNLDLGAIDLDLSIVQNGNFLLWRASRSIKQFYGDLFVLEIKTHDDHIDELDGSVTVTLNPTSEYVPVLGKNTVTVAIRDNDEAGQNELPRISVASVVANAILQLPQFAPPRSETAVATPSLPTVSIQAAELVVDEGGIAAFRVISLSDVDGVSISVALQVTSVGDFFNFNHATTRILSLRGEDSTDLYFPTIDDVLAEDDGSITVSITADSSFLIAKNQGSATVVISDAIDRQARQELITARAQAFLPDVVGNLAARTSDTIKQRFQQAFSDTGDLVLNLGGQESVRGMIQSGGEYINNDSTSLRSLLGDSSFAFSLLSADQFATPATVWGIGDYRNLSSNSSGEWTGEVFTGHIGIDALVGQGLLTGMSASFNENLVNFNINGESDDSLEYGLASTSINPYIGWNSPSDDAEIRAIAGYGVGEFNIDQTNYDIETLTSRSYAFAIAGNKVLYSSDSILSGKSKLSLIGESWLARQYIDGKDGVLANLQTDAQYYRIQTEVAHKFEFDRSSSFTPLVSLGMRGDKKTNQSTLGMELTGSLDYVNLLGLTFSGTGRMLLANKNTVQKMSASSTFEFDFDNDNIGTILSLSSSWGQSDADVQNTLWSSNILEENSDSGQYTIGTQVNSKIGYGFAINDKSGILTFYSGYEYDDQQQDELMLGTDISFGSNFGFDVEGSREIGTKSSIISKVQFNGHLSW